MKKITKLSLAHVIIFLAAVLAGAGIIIFLPKFVSAAKIVIKRNVVIGHSIQSLINQKFQTKDDWLDSGGTSGEYTGEEATWRTVPGSPFSGYDAIDYLGNNDLYSGTVKQDTRTGLWWSDIMAIGAVASTTKNVFTLSGDGSRPTGGTAIGFCDALNSANFGGQSNWYLPTQKELIQAYIDGAANNLPNVSGSYFWSSTENSSDTAYAWRVILTSGTAASFTKTTLTNVRCVRR